MQTAGEIVSQEVEQFKRGSVSLTQGILYSQYYTIQRINKYVANRFWECTDEEALFWNISNQRIPLYSKSIDMDTKDFYVTGVGKTNWFQAWILNVRYKKWSRESRLALTLDDISTGIGTYGSMVWKKVDRDGEVAIEASDLRNLYFDPTVKNIIDSPVVELHYMVESQIRALWPDKASEVIEKATEARDNEDNRAETEDEKYEIWERWGEREIDEDKKITYMHDVGAGFGDNEVILVEDEVSTDKNGVPKDFPYFDFHGERVSGRWMGLGVVERLFPLQEQINTLVNQNAEANNIASLLLFKTADPDTTGNILQAAQSGQIINSQDMAQMAIDNRFIQTFLSQLQTIEDKADRICFITESISGDTPPSGTPFRSLAVSTRASLSTFRYIKTSIGEKMGFILEEEILPSLVKGFNKEDIIEIAEDDNDIRLYDETYIETAVTEFKKDRAEKGLVVFEEDLTEVKIRAAKAVERNRRVQDIGKKFFDFEYGVSMNPTGESVDKNVQNGAIDSAIEQIIASRGEVLDMPIFKQKLSNNQIPPFRLTGEQKEKLAQGTGAKLPEAPVDKLSELAQE